MPRDACLLERPREARHHLPCVGKAAAGGAQCGSLCIGHSITCLLEAKHQTDAGPCGIIPSPAASIHSLGENSDSCLSRGEPYRKVGPGKLTKEQSTTVRAKYSFVPCLDSLHQDMIPIATETGKSERQTRPSTSPPKDKMMCRERRQNSFNAVQQTMEKTSQPMLS